MRHAAKWLIAALLVLALFLFWHWVGYTRAEQEAIAIIGGADGPTSILIGKIAP
jgi:Na+-transporting methylmalonyl-CoA/oxaloacetate decarboxylase beta subunit